MDDVNRGRWTEDEDALLRQSVEKHGPKNWRVIAAVMHNRTDVQCLHRCEWAECSSFFAGSFLTVLRGSCLPGQKVLKPGLVKGPWTVEVRIFGMGPEGPRYRLTSFPSCRKTRPYALSLLSSEPKSGLRCGVPRNYPFGW
jgi:hypothetical protein